MVETLDFALLVADVDREPQRFLLSADSSEREAARVRLDLVRLDQFSADLSVRKTREAVIIEGEIQADLAQRCVVTLEPVPAVIKEHFTLELVSAEEAARRDSEEVFSDPDAPDYDTLDADRLVLGEIAVQSLAIALDPYPRHPSADVQVNTLPGVEFNAPPLAPENPFNALKGLKSDDDA